MSVSVRNWSGKPGQSSKKQKEKELKKKSTGMGAKDFSKKYKSKRTVENSRNTKNARGVKKTRK